MDALATRLGRFEAELQALRHEVLQLHSQSLPPVESASVEPSGNKEDALVPWVRLFERELEAVRRCAESFEEPLSILDHRVERLESVALPESGQDLDELAELVLEELRTLQLQVNSLAVTGGQPSGFSRGQETLQPRALGDRLQGHSGEMRSPSSTKRSPISKAAARVEAFQRLEALSAGLETRVSKLEKEVLASPAEEGQGETSHLQDRLRHLESEVESGLQPLRRHQVSLRALEETSMKVEQLQKTLQQLPLDTAVQRSADAITALEAEGRLRAGPLSLLDAHKVQTSLDQVMTAMEALVRQRNADVQLVNGYLGEVYRRIERDLPSDKGQSIFQKLERIQGQTSAVRAECHSIADVRIKELEERLLHEAATTAELAESNRRQVTRLELALQDALDQLRAAEARLPALQDLTERRAASETAREAAMSELRKDLSRLRQDVSQLTTEGGFAGSERQHASFSALSATLMARVDKEAKETSRVFAGLEDQLKSLHERVRAAEIAGSSASNFSGDLQLLAQDFASLRGESARADVELRERVARGERELKAEIRAAQRLLLEVAEGARHLSPERLTAPLANAKGAPMAAPLPALPGFGTPPASGGVELDVGSLAPRGTAAIAWSVPGVRARTRFGNAQPMISEAFDVEQFPDVKALRLKLFPLGSRRRTKPGHCSLYLTGPQGAHLQFLLRLGSVEHGPLECIFDRPEKDSGRHDFCTLEDELEVDGSALVHLTVIRADLVPVPEGGGQ